MRLIAFLGLALMAGSSAAAQTVPETPKLGTAPWWMQTPIIASVGYVEVEAPANRARFSATFEALAKTTAEASAKATEKARDLGQALAAIGEDKVGVQFTLSITPLYEQYRDRDGNRVDNERADRIEQYQASVQVTVAVRDIAYLQEAVNRVAAAQPNATSSFEFTLQPTDEAKTQISRQAMSDAARRAREAAEAVGARLGPVKLIDPTGRACQTDVLITGAPASSGPGVMPRALSEVGANAVGASSLNLRSLGTGRTLVTVNGQRSGSPESFASLPINPPLHKLTAQSCVVYALG